MVAATKRIKDKKILRELIPLNALSETHFEEITRNVEVVEIQAGKYLFRKGDRDNKSVYLLEGVVNLIDENRAIAGIVELGTDISRYPIANQQPRPLSARAATRVLIARIDSSLLDVLLTWDQSSGCEVVDIKAEEDEDWMTRMLQSDAFIRLPPADLQRLLMTIESVPANAGKVVVREGDEGDYFYIVREGRCSVTRISPNGGPDEMLAELVNGDCFGEEALVSENRRNATVTMLTDGTLMRLAKKDFIELLKKPLVHYINHEQAASMVEDGAVWLDVRLPGEYANFAFEDSVNIPLSTLRDQVSELIFNTKYIIYCDTGRRSASAAFILSHRGFEVFVLENGLNGGVPPEALSRSTVGPALPDHSERVDDETEEEGAEIIDFSDRQDDSGVSGNQGTPVLDEEIGKMHAEIDRLKSELETAVGDRDHSNRAQVDLLEEIKSLEQRLAENGVEMSRLTNEVAEERRVAQAAREQFQSEEATLRDELEEEKSRAGAEIERLQHWIESAGQSSDEGSDALQQQCVSLKKALMEKDRGLEATVSEMEGIARERDAARQCIDKLQQEVVALQEQLSGNGQATEAETASLKQEVADREVKLREAELRAEESEGRITGLEEELSRISGDKAVAEQGLEDSRREIEELKEQHVQALKDAMDQATSNNDGLEKIQNQLKEQNDLVNRQQGKIDRLRKKLEHATAEMQEMREKERENIAYLRDELATERQARAEERSQMAARQKELKDQLAAVSHQHEAAVQNHPGELAVAKDEAREEERVRLQFVLDEQERTDQQLAALRAELERAHAEAAHAVEQERAQHEADHALLRQEVDQSKSTIGDLEERLAKATEERNLAESDVKVFREEANTLRAEVEVARGLMGVEGNDRVEDPVVLREQLEEARKNVEIAVRLRAEAVSARDISEQERRRLHQRLEKIQGGIGDAEPPLDEPSPNKEGDQSPAGSATENIGGDLSYSTESRPVSRPASRPIEPVYITEKKKTRVGIPGIWLVASMAIVAIAGGILFFLQLKPETSVPSESEPVALEAQGTESVPRTMDNVVEAVPEVPVVPELQPATERPDPYQPVQTAYPGATVSETATADTGQVDSQEKTVISTTPLSFYDTLAGGGRGPVVTTIGPGNFRMGSGTISLSFEERPRHEVSLQAFAIGKYEVSFAEYEQFARATGRIVPGNEGWGGGNRPVINVSWGDAVAYTRWLSEQTGHVYRLPTEAEWEYAARAGTEYLYWWGPEPSTNLANCFNCGSKWDDVQTAPVGRFTANGFGLHDTAGNVMEWVQDCYHPNYQGAPDDGTAWVEPGCTLRVSRGGSFSSPLDSLRSSKRNFFEQYSRLDNLGFRVVREL